MYDLSTTVPEATGPSTCSNYLTSIIHIYTPLIDSTVCNIRYSDSGDQLWENATIF